MTLLQVYLLLGALPIEAELHKRHLSLLYNILTSSNTTIKDLAARQIAINLENQHSYFARVQEILNLYRLPQLRDLNISHMSKEQWKKKLIKNAVNEYWTVHFQSEAKQESTLLYLNIEQLKIGSTHTVWSSLESTVTEVRMGITECRMFTGTYLLQTNKYRFSKANEDATCKCCGLADEDMIHMLLECPAFYVQRKQYFSNVRSIVLNCIGIRHWEEIFKNKVKLVQLILDCSKFQSISDKPDYLRIVKATTEMCHNLHVARLQKLSA